MANGVKNRISTAVKELETLCNNWLAQPPLAVETAVVTAVKGVDGAVIRSVLDTIIFYFVSAYSSPSRAISLKPRWIDARNTGVLIGANAGITCVMKRIRGKEDSQTRMVAGFGAGVLFSMVRRDPPVIVIVSGVMFALLEESIFKVID